MGNIRTQHCKEPGVMCAWPQCSCLDSDTESMMQISGRVQSVSCNEYEEQAKGKFQPEIEVVLGLHSIRQGQPVWSIIAPRDIAPGTYRAKLTIKT